MALTPRYLASAKNIHAIFRKIQEGVPPINFNREHLEAIGFKGSPERAIIPLLKDLGFLAPDGTPTQIYKDYRDPSRAKNVMADSLRNAYGDLFTINEKISKSDRPQIEGRYKSTHSSTERVAELQAATFICLLELADLGDASIQKSGSEKVPDRTETKNITPTRQDSLPHKSTISLGYKIEIVLPATKDIEIYNAIFKSIRTNLLDD